MRALLLSALLVVSLAAVAPAGAQDAASEQRPNACVGTITDQPDRSTIVSIQGSRITPDGAEKKPALLVSLAPDGSFEWAQNSSANGRWWAYDVDPLADGSLLYATTEPGISVIGAFDPASGTYDWVKRFDGAPDDATTPLVTDAHDVDRIGEHELAIVDKGEGHERLLVYNRTADRVAWEWRFENHPEAFPTSGGGPPDDWTHVNDVELVGEDLYMLSVRNFDQVAFVNRTTGAVDLTLGADDAYDVLNEQHNPDHLWGPDGEHTVLVADSMNDRVVEYEYQAGNDTWQRVWSVAGFDEPRDADRLQNGNTLVVDRVGHRVLEVTPEGETVWEVYTPFEPYDIERGAVDESVGPTMAGANVSGQYEVTGDAAFTTAEIERCGRELFSFARPSLTTGGVDPFTEGNGSWTPSAGTAPGDQADPGGEQGGDGGLPRAGIGAVAAVVIGVAAGVWYRRR